MTWLMPYIIVRCDGNGASIKVHEADKIKDARYWLSYIAQPGDALFQTPAHPKHEGGDKPIYKAHLIDRGNVGYEEQDWLRMISKDGSVPALPPE